MLLSSLHEGLSTVVLESLIIGNPVITTDCSGMKELIDNGKTGLICENSEEGIYNLLKYVLDNPGVLEQFKDNIKNTNGAFHLKNRMKPIENLLLENV